MTFDWILYQIVIKNNEILLSASPFLLLYKHLVGGRFRKMWFLYNV